MKPPHIFENQLCLCWLSQFEAFLSSIVCILYTVTETKHSVSSSVQCLRKNSGNSTSSAFSSEAGYIIGGHQHMAEPHEVLLSSQSSKVIFLSLKSRIIYLKCHALELEIRLLQLQTETSVK